MSNSANVMAVTGIGMVTPVGLNAVASCAAVRAGLVRFNELADCPLRDQDGKARVDAEGNPLVVVTSSVQGLDAPESDTDRLQVLLSAALDDLFTQIDTRVDGQHTAAVLALPSGQPAPISDRSFEQLISKASGQGATFGKTAVYAGDNAGLIEGLAELWPDLSRGTYRRAIVAGVDSLVGTTTLNALYDQGRLKTRNRPVGLIPAEASCVLVLETLNEAQQRGAEVLATVEGPAIAHDPAADDTAGVCEGVGLSHALRQTLEQVGTREAPRELLIADINGEPYRSEELAYAQVRVLSDDRTDWPLWHPADSLGATGAASASIAIAVATRAFCRGYAPADAAMITASSPGSLRGSVYVRAFASGK